jgi:hypothetical protein
VAAGLTADDRFEILELIVRYCYGFDDGDVDVVAQAFAPDGVLQTVPKTFTGREAVRGHAANSFSERPWQRHQTTDPWIEPVEGRSDAARGRVYFTYSTEGVLVHGTYTDDFVKLDGRWYIAYRTVSIQKET